MLDILAGLAVAYIVCGVVCALWLLIADSASRDDLRTEKPLWAVLGILLLVAQWPLFVWFVATWDGDE